MSTWAFIRENDLDDTFKIAEMLLTDDHDLIRKATGGWLREAGKRDRPRLLEFLDEHAATMPRTALRYATEHLDKELRAHHLGLGVVNPSVRTPEPSGPSTLLPRDDRRGRRSSGCT